MAFLILNDDRKAVVMENVALKKHRCALSLIAALMLTTLSVTGCGANVNANLNKTEEPSEASESGSDDETEDRSENEASDTAI